eukprot:6204919-Pleurochrysis_carterae.AAC.1
MLPTPTHRPPGRHFCCHAEPWRVWAWLVAEWCASEGGSAVREAVLGGLCKLHRPRQPVAGKEPPQGAPPGLGAIPRSLRGARALGASRRSLATQVLVSDRRLQCSKLIRFVKSTNLLIVGCLMRADR